MAQGKDCDEARPNKARSGSDATICSRDIVGPWVTGLTFPFTRANQGYTTDWNHHGRGTPCFWPARRGGRARRSWVCFPPHECRYARRMLLLLQLAMFAMCWGTRSQRLQLTSLGILVLAASTGKNRECHVLVENANHERCRLQYY